MSKALGINAIIFGVFGIIFALINVGKDIYAMFGRLIGLPMILPWSLLIVAVICGGIGFKKDDSPSRAIAGLILGAIGFVITILVLSKQVYCINNICYI